MVLKSDKLRVHLEIIFVLGVGTEVRICFVAHPDDDALWFGNTELLVGFDCKIVLTYSAAEPRAQECVSWTRAVNPDCNILFLGFEDNRAVIPTVDDVVNKLVAFNVPSSVSALYTHSVNGEYGHQHHKIVKKVALQYFKARRMIVPHYPENNDSAQFTISGPKFNLIKIHFPSQISGLAKNLRRYCDYDFLDVESDTKSVPHAVSP